MRRLFLTFLLCLLVLTVTPGCGREELPESVETPQPTACVHSWSEGVCSLCDEACPHAEHNAESLLCTSCGQRQRHHYTNCLCSCGAEPQFVTSREEISSGFFPETDQHGSLECFFFSKDDLQPAPGNRSQYSDREFVVYTPYGYNPEKQYDVLLLSHGAGNFCHYWLERAHGISAAYPHITGAELLDRMIAAEMIEPLIVVSTEYRNNGTPAEIAEPYGLELRNCILPFIARNYGTYASFDEQGRLLVQREHFAFAAGSFGSMIIWEGLMEQCGDLFSYWGCYSGNLTTAGEMAEMFSRMQKDGTSPNFVYNGGGAGEIIASADDSRFREAAACSNLELGKNACSLYVENKGHGYGCWYICLYNSLQVFFLNEYVP